MHQEHRYTDRSELFDDRNKRRCHRRDRSRRSVLIAFAGTMLGVTSSGPSVRAAGKEKRRDQAVTPILDWNDVLLDQIRDESLSPPAVTRGRCLLNLSIYDAVNGINRVRPEEDGYEQYEVTADVDQSASRSASANAAGYEILEYYFGTNPSFDDIYDELKASISGRDVEKGDSWGRDVANEIIGLRREDGHDAHDDYDACADSACHHDGNAKCTSGIRIGCFREADWGSSHFADLDPWTRNGSQDRFRPAGPPPLDSAITSVPQARCS